MIIPEHRINNKVTGDQIEFLKKSADYNGEISEFITTLAPGSSWAKSPRHFHPFQTETFKVLSGELNLTVGKEHYVLRPEDGKILVEPFVLHSFWNDTDSKVSFQAEVIPPINIEKGIWLMYRLGSKGMLFKNNLPKNPFYALLMMEMVDSYFGFLPWKFQRFMFKLGGKTARLLGYSLEHMIRSTE